MESFEDDDVIVEPGHTDEVEERTTARPTLAALAKTRNLPKAGSIERLRRSLSPAERLALGIFIFLMALSALILVIGVNDLISVAVPMRGGELTEGEVGPARFINPILAVSQPDQDLTALVYSGLMRQMPDGSIVPDLAQSYTVSPDGTIYTFKLRPDATFQDGTPVTAADVLFTIQETQDATINSPRAADWDGVTVSSPDPETVVFTLPHAYAPFIEDTTMGILPEHLWQNVADTDFAFSPLNTHPVGSGPYEISNVTTDSTGAAERYDLVPFPQFTLGEAYLSRISFVFYPDEATMLSALQSGAINAAASVDPSAIAGIQRSDLSLVETPLPRVFAVFFDQANDAALSDSAARAALNAAVDKQAIVSSVLNGYGATLEGPIPPGIIDNPAPATPEKLSTAVSAAAASARSVPATPSSTATSTATSTASAATTTTSIVAQAQSILTEGGWIFSESTGTWTKGKQTLSLTLSTADEPELVSTVDAVAADWRAIGVQVAVQVYPLSELNTTVMRPRSYDALLFGEVVGPQLDLYAFWNSSQRNDPGLNLAMYANSQTDSLLTQARATTDTDARDKLYEQFATLLVKDNPAVFLYAPDFLYVVPSDIKNVQVGSLSDPAGRFDNVYQWYEDTSRVWTIFAPQSAFSSASSTQ